MGARDAPGIEAEIWPGESGLLELEYTGLAKRPTSRQGPATGCFYRFGGERRVGYVDKRDALAWLGVKETEEQRRTFRLWRP